MNDFAKILDDAMQFALTRGVEDMGLQQAERVAQAWESAGQWRILAVMMWLRKLSHIERSDPEKLMEVLPGAVDFVLRFMGKRFIGIFFDGLGLLVRHDEHKVIEVARMARNSAYSSKGRTEAAIFGISGAHYYDPARYDKIEDMDY